MINKSSVRFFVYFFIENYTKGDEETSYFTCLHHFKSSFKGLTEHFRVSGQKKRRSHVKKKELKNFMLIVFVFTLQPNLISHEIQKFSFIYILKT